VAGGVRLRRSALAAAAAAAFSAMILAASSAGRFGVDFNLPRRAYARFVIVGPGPYFCVKLHILKQITLTGHRVYWYNF
jgi:hypothetical protein